MVKNILIRNLTVDDNRMLQEIKRETGHQQASRALLRTGHDYLRLLETSGLQREKIGEQKTPTKLRGDFKSG